ncbi:MAG: D-aminoacylase [Clostridia bacterium]|nr:D-aminoacylase [Clostridia bacterium]
MAESIQTADIIIRGGTIIDGAGGPRFRGDVAVKNGKIAAIGDLNAVRAQREFSAEGLAVAPGFIDAHAHSDTEFTRDSSGASKLYQGITTEISGNCGDSPFPAAPGNKDEWQLDSFSDFLKAFSARHCSMAVNQALLAGHGALRKAVVGSGSKAASPAELTEMKRLLRRDLQDGAWGLSLGLEYAPGCFADQQELNELGKIAAETDGIVTCHMRSEGLQIDSALEELKEVGRSSGAHVHASHLKLDHYTVHGRAPQVWSAIENANREGIRFTADMYPYTASATALSIRCPRWSMDGGPEALLEHLQSETRKEIVEGIRRHYFNAQRAETCLFSDDGGLWPQIVGKTLRYVAESMLHTEDYADAAAQVLLRTQARAQCVFFVMNEQDMLYFLSQDICIGSDGYALPGDPERLHYNPHPRSYGAIAEFFRIAREKRLCSLEEAVRRVTSKPADIFSIRDRGRLAAGMAADITVFDPASIAPRSTYLNAVQLAQGVQLVLVNGAVALQNGRQTEERAGQLLRRSIGKQR